MSTLADSKITIQQFADNWNQRLYDTTSLPPIVNSPRIYILRKQFGKNNKPVIEKYFAIDSVTGRTVTRYRQKVNLQSLYISDLATSLNPPNPVTLVPQNAANKALGGLTQTGFVTSSLDALNWTLVTGEVYNPVWGDSPLARGASVNNLRISGHPFDRNAVTKVSNYSNGALPPAGDTARLFSPVQSANKQWIATFSINAQRVTPGNPAGVFLAWLSITPQGGAATYNHGIILATNVVGEIQSIVIPSVSLQTGDAFSLRTSDTTVGGTVAIRMGYSLTEFDD